MRTFLFLIVMGVTALGLKLLGSAGVLLQKEGPQKYPSLEEAKKELKLGGVQLPAYFPQYLEWPPFEIIAQEKPFTMILMHFRERGTKNTVLSIQQMDSKFKETLTSRIEPDQIAKKGNILIKERPIVFFHSFCRDGLPCNKVVWEEGGHRFSLVAKDSVEELLKIAGSM